MDGYCYIMNSTTERLANCLGVSLADAYKIKMMTREELNRCESICPEDMKGINYMANCREKLYCCYDCRKEFLDAEIQDWSEDNNS